jgi:hypothetical protein
MSAVSMAACSGGGEDVDAGAVAHHAYDALNKHASGIIASPQVVTLTYPGYANKAGVEAFADYIVTSDWLTAVGDEYGVKHGASVAKHVMSVPAPTGMTPDAQIAQDIIDEINKGGLPVPAANTNLIYMLYLPPGSTITEFQDAYGYHNTATLPGGVYFPYAIIMDCNTGVGTVTTTASHELIESATDPYTAPNPEGFYMDVLPDDPFWFASGNEAADLCDYEPTFREGGFEVQKSWSNAAAATGGAPCVPALSPDWEAVDATPHLMPHATPGQVLTFTITGWSTTTVPDWAIKVVNSDNSDYTAAQLKPVLVPSVINNGQTATLMLTVPTTATSGTAGGVYIMSGVSNRFWPVGFQVP